MTYAKYLLKLGLKNKLNLIPLLIPILLMIFLFIMNSQAIGKAGYIGYLNEDLQLMETVLTNQENILVDDKNITEQDEKEIKEANIFLTENIKLKEKAISLAQQEKWKDSLNIEIKLMEENELKDIEKDNFSSSEDFANSIHKTYARYTKLVNLNEEPQTEGLEVKGVNFVFRMMDSVFPLVFVLCLIAWMSTILSASIVGRLDIEQLFPENSFTFYLKKILVLTGLGILFYCLFLSSTFIVSSIFSGTGTLQYPINLFSEGFKQTIPIITVLIKAGILQILSILFIISAVSFISILVKNGLTTLFISTVVLLGAILLTGKIAPVNAVIHVLPTTYVNAIQVVTNQLAFETHNAGVTFTNGIVVLICSIILLIGVTLGIKVYKRKKKCL